MNAQETINGSADPGAANPFLNGQRVRFESERITPFSSPDGSLCFERQSTTLVRGPGQFETHTVSPNYCLPDGTRVGKAEEITSYCYKYHRGGTTRGCGPLTREHIYPCTRCIRAYCSRHTWKPLFSPNRYCWWCLCIRALELFLSGIGLVFKLIALLFVVLWRGWWGLFNR